MRRKELARRINDVEDMMWDELKGLREKINTNRTYIDRVAKQGNEIVDYLEFLKKEKDK